MSVAFTPGSNGGSAILFYTATCTGGGTSGFATGPQSPIVVTGLTDSKVYTCRVTATNALGTSLPSAPSTPSVVGGAPGAPTIVEVRPLATFSATGALAVFFTVGPNNGTAITSFHASCTSTTGGVGGSSDGAHGPIVVSGLTTGARYLCTTTATNAKGTSPDSLAVKGVVGAPVKPAILRVLSMPNGLAVAIAPGPNNGSAIISYRARCTSTNGGLPSSPLQVVSPIIVSSLTPGATYTCRVTANNLRGEGPPSVSAAAVVGTPFTKVTCTGSAGTMNADHGLYLSRTEPQTFALDATASNCNGSYVTAGRIRASFRTATPTTCPNLTTVTSGGSGTLTWTAPTGLGTAGATLQLVFVSTAGHVTQAHFSGTVTSKGNLFTQRHVSGNITLNRGLKPVASGGDCTALIPLTTFAVTAISFSIT
jgi:titin